tara:strand:+ start:3850 stop:4239 length:390 start_codon:yes stop_codon:yes gene_type:complete
MKRDFYDVNVYSNVLFFINSLLYLSIDYYVCSISLFMAFVASTMYHFHFEKNVFWNNVDKITATNALLITLIYAFLNITFFHFINLCIIATLNLYTKKLSNDNYSNHYIWHIVVFFGQSYIFGMLYENV